MAYCEFRFMNDILLEDVAFKKVDFLFGLEDSNVQVKFKSLFCSLSLIPVRIVNKFLLSLSFIPRSL